MSESIPSGVRIYIRTEALKNNFLYIKNTYPSSEHGAVVKANGYGMGAAPVAQVLEEAGCSSFYVARPAEALQLKKTLSPQSKIYIFHGHEPSLFPLYEEQGFIPVLHSLETLNACLDYAQTQPKPMTASIKINTGMNRLGLDPEDLEKIDWTSVQSHLAIESVHSHLACGRTSKHPLNPKQYDLFLELCNTYFPNTPKGLSASCQIGLPSCFSLDRTRQGLNLFGAYSPADLPNNPLEFALTVQAKILQTRTLKKGASVGYDAQFIAPKDMTLATLSMGYADGLPLSLSNKEIAFRLGDFFVPLVGQISMDLATIDVSDVPDSVLQENSWVDVFYDNMSLYTLAKAAESSKHDIILGLGPRCERLFV